MKKDTAPGAALQQRLRGLSAADRAKLQHRLETKQASGYALLADALRCCGIKQVLGVTGVPVDAVFPECAARGIRPIGTHHQQAAVLAAAAANYVAGRLESAVVVSAGPAITNTLTGVLVARDNGWPVIVLGGRWPVQEAGSGHFQELDAIPLLQPVTKWAAIVSRTSEMREMVFKAFEFANRGRPGPVYLDLPQDVLAGIAEDGGPPGPTLETRPEAEPNQVAQAARILRSADRPLLVLGEGIRWSFDQTSLLRLVEGCGLPFITTPLGRGFLPDTHPLCVNDVRRWIQSQADLVVLAGAWFDWRFRFGAELQCGTRIIQADVDPLTLGKNLQGALTICADGGRFLCQLADAMDSTAACEMVERLEPWRALARGACFQKRQARAAWLAEESNPMGPQELFREIRSCLPASAVVVLDGSITLSTGQAALSAQTPCGWLDPGWNGCMGSGIPFGLGAKLASPERLVVVICGDFGFGLSAMELETAVRHQIPIIVVIANNDGIAGSTRQQRFLADHPERFSQFLPALRYERMMEVFGGHAEWVTEACDIRPALERAVASGRAACINVRVAPDARHPGFW